MTIAQVTGLSRHRKRLSIMKNSYWISSL